jgi:glutathione S-transferase
MQNRRHVQIVGRSSSHFTRVATIYAHEVGVPYELVVVPDLLSLETENYGGHPALKLPALRVDGALLVGTENICRRLVELAGRENDSSIVWPEHTQADVVRNAQELTWHAMAAQVQLVLGRGTAASRAEDLFFTKARAGFVGALVWLDAHVDAALDALPRDRSLSLLEVAMFCLVEHLGFRPTVPLDPYENLRRFAAAYSARPSAMATPYRIDPLPEKSASSNR